ncbi:MAG: hypothetical protein QF890_09875 [Myxococcota bacterium]|jgi:hypothetical protein|nr:hypothetical protein [bacterium]MDP6076517.1 hypothetical protein [Myxococcota bacterium]MDP6242193.1 hypothetical protein [Myxococcota bacterium]MDP7075697.1 hypothetical protein [Myxococcota bacterium]MDP7297925.1 hypothetical protein [Myxococcota bacterium]
MYRFFLTTLLVIAAAGASASAEVASAGDVLERLGFGAGELQKVLAGEMAERKVQTNARDDLAIVLSFLVSVPPKKFDYDLTGETFVFQLDPNTLAGSEITGNGSLDNFAELSLSAAERSTYARASAGETLNFSSSELSALDSLKDAGPDVDAALKKILLARFRAYREKGLAGIAPYERGDGKSTNPGLSLREDSKASVALTSFDPAFARFLVDYPAGTPPGLKEKFYWLHYEAHGEPVLALTHAFSAPVGQWRVFCQRQFYVSRGYNAEQALALFLPVREGTLVAYLNFTSTDQVLGFGGSAKRAIGERLMMSQLSDLFQRLRKAAVERQ